MSNIVVTSGNKYLDIDGYAGCIAYARLLNGLGYNAVSVSSALPNESVSSLIKELGLKFDAYVPTISDQFIVLDVSNPQMIDHIVVEERIIEIIDHHMGFADYWLNKNIKTDVSLIGSICTIIFEKYVQQNKLDLLDKNLCQILIAGILDNTLNLKADITTSRDIDAYHKLRQIGHIEEEWGHKYFMSCQIEMENHLEESINNCIKNEYVSDELPQIFGQLLVYNKDFILKHFNQIRTLFNRYGLKWLLNIICLEDGQSYIMAEDSTARQQLEIFFNKIFENGLLVLNRFMLRKEIMKKARDRQRKL